MLAKPLGFTLARWPQDPQGIYFGGNDMLLTPRQMVQFGELYLNRGRVGEAPGRALALGRRFVRSARPLAITATRCTATAGGCASWPASRRIYAWGFGGQYIFVDPARSSWSS